MLDTETADVWPPLNFYPDGSFDAARVVLGSPDVEDTRRIEVTLDGDSGRISAAVYSAHAWNRLRRENRR
jgi:hypothetical protein